MSTNHGKKSLRGRLDPLHTALLVAIVVPYGLLRASGFAQSTAMLSGTLGDERSVALGALYVVLHLLACVVAPCLAVAATLDALLVLRRNRARADATFDQK